MHVMNTFWTLHARRNLHARQAALILIGRARKHSVRNRRHLLRKWMRHLWYVHLPHHWLSLG